MTLTTFLNSLSTTARDVLPITVILVLFQLFVLRKPIANLSQVVFGFGCVLVGLTLFLIGLDLALFPLGKTMAIQLTNPAFLSGSTEQPSPPPLTTDPLALPEADAHPFAASPASTGTPGSATTPQTSQTSPLSDHPPEHQLSAVPKDAIATVPWTKYGWTYLFAFAIAFSATLAEPALLAVATKAEVVSGGTLRALPLRLAVATGAGVGVFLGTLRIVLGVPLPYFILSGYALIILQTQFAPRQIIPLAYDSGGVTTSTVTVPLVAALGLGLASQIPGRSPLLEGFGMIALAVLFPMMTVMGYAQIAQWRISRRPAATPTSP